jgi:NAD(P)-dependent dehydrogenase (short-subunit alcohol dehydrogenase family)
VTAYLDELFSLAGRVALVTGGSSGIGRVIAEALGRAGARVVVMARREGPLRETVRELAETGVDAAYVSADLADRQALHAAADRATEPYGEPDILVTAAAINLRPPLSTLSVSDWDTTMAINLDAPFLLGQRYAPGMAERGWGRIVNLVSQQAVRAFGNSGAYGASKGGVAALTRSQAEAWSRYGVCCNAIAPGVVRTPMTAATFADPQRAAATAARTMVGRNGEAEDFAGLAVFLTSPSCAFLTGQTIFLDGGFSST